MLQPNLTPGDESGSVGQLCQAAGGTARDSKDPDLQQWHGGCEGAIPGQVKLFAPSISQRIGHGHSQWSEDCFWLGMYLILHFSCNDLHV